MMCQRDWSSDVCSSVLWESVNRWSRCLSAPTKRSTRPKSRGETGSSFPVRNESGSARELAVMFSWRPMSMPQMLSILTPMYNEAGGLDAFFQSLEAALAPLDVDYEIICVDDGSSDNTLARLRHQVERNPRTRVVVLSRSCGRED